MKNLEGIRPGLTAERTITVAEQHTVSHTNIPILSTPTMISIMESVANDLVQPLLPDGWVTVGYEVHVKHKAPARLGSVLVFQARLLEVEGRKLLFEVHAGQGKTVIGTGLHRRTMIRKAG